MSNGRLPASALAAIPQGHLEKHAAAYWNAMIAEARRRWGITLVPVGPMASYRTYAQQVYLWGLYLRGQGNLAARPGTSNHGLGLAVDLANQHMRWIVDQIGRTYGFSKACSDAPSEWWHIRFSPACTGATWRPSHAVALPTLRKGTKHTGYVRKLQRLLRHKGFKTVRVNGSYDLATRRAVRRVQKAHHLPVDGECGPKTWRAVLR